MVYPVSSTKDWSIWFRIDDEAAKKTVPIKPGVYEVRTNFDIGRLRGSSPLVTIGSAVTSLRKRLCDQRFGRPVRFLNRAEKWLDYEKYPLEFRYCTTTNGKEARYLEMLLLMEYENEHWELPPGNEDLPLKIIREEIKQKYGDKIEIILRDLLEKHKTADSVAVILGVPQYVISSLVVFYGIK